MTARAPDRYRVLHAGSGGDTLPPWLDGDQVRLDIDPATGPDVVASMTDMGDVGQFDVVYCSHALEHLHPHEVGTALAEFRRVLVPGGKAVVVVPDLEDVRPTDDVLYVCPAGPVCGLDLFYGMRPLLAARPHMAHRTGFVRDTLAAALRAAGFSEVLTRRVPDFNLLAIASK